MGDGASAEIPAARRHIIRRPRLTRLLDESNARIIMLVAPAGYGKTTLTREWLEDRRHAWYQGGPASADVAALAVGLAEAVGDLVPGAGSRLRERLRATSSPEQDVEPLADLLAEDLAAWPADAWLAFDDYHFASEAPAAETFVDLLLRKAPVRLLLTSRRRPAWATSRRILYGEISEFGTPSLAMTNDEASEVLADRPRSLPQKVVALAHGWPAVIGLASLTHDSALPEGRLPNALYDFFAGELYEAMSADLKRALAQLAAAPRVSTDLGQHLFGRAYTRVLADASRAGFLLPNARGDYDFHPLLQEFLRQKFATIADDELEEALTAISAYFMQNSDWDSIFELVQAHKNTRLFHTMLHEGSRDFLAAGRLTTVSRWLAYASEIGVDDPMTDLLAAELAFREGHHVRAAMLSSHAAKNMEHDHSCLWHSLTVAGKAWHLAHNDVRGLDCFRRARSVASSGTEKEEAVWGELLCAASLEHPDAWSLLDELDALPDETPTTALRRAAARRVVGSRLGTLHDAIARWEATEHLLAKVHDPLVRCSVLNSYALVLSLVARYEEGLRVSQLELEEARKFRLPFAAAHGYTLRAYAELGVRRFSDAAKSLRKAYAAAGDIRDEHVEMNARALDARLHISQGLFDAALSITAKPWDPAPEPSMLGEYAATRALAFACAGVIDGARKLAQHALQVTSGVEARVLAAAAEAVVALQLADEGKAAFVARAYDEATVTGNYDGLICAYRGYPPLLAALADSDARRWKLAVLLAAGRDHTLAKSIGIDISAQGGRIATTLSPREQDVLTLLVQGKTNREIASILFISESTAKVHVRHILEKLRVRSRTEAAVMAAAEGFS